MGIYSSPSIPGGDYPNTRSRPDPGRKRRPWAIALLAVILAFLLLRTLAYFLMQSYVDMASGIEVAQVSSATTSVPGRMLVTLTLYNKDGYQIADKFIVKGDELNLQGDKIIYAPWLSVLGLYSGYKITGCKGQYAERQYKPFAVDSITLLNGGDDNLFMFVQEHAWLSPLAEAIHDAGVLVPLDGKTHSVFLLPTGLVVSA